MLQLNDAFAYFHFRADDDLRGSTRRWGPKVRNEIADREIDLVADSRDDRLLASHDGTRYTLFIERPQIFHRSTTTGHDDDIHVGAAEAIDAFHNLKRCCIALNLGRKNQNVDRVVAAFQDTQNVSQCSTLGRRNNSDLSRKSGNWPFPLRSEETFFRQLLFELFKRQLKSSQAGRLQDFNDKLIFTPAFVRTDAAARAEKPSVLRPKSKQTRSISKAYGGELSPVIFEGEIQMARTRSLEIRDLPFNPDINEAALQEVADFAAELGNGVDLPLKFGVSHADSIGYRSCGLRPRQIHPGKVWLKALPWGFRFPKALS